MKKKLRNNKKTLRGKEAWVYLLLVVCGCLGQGIDSYAQTRVNFTIQGEKPRKPISPYVYGTNDPYPQASAKRLGGNRITSYNWENNASNAEPAGGPKPDSETLHTTDPQENMEGPVSTSIEKLGEAFDSGENKEEADREKEKNM